MMSNIYNADQWRKAINQESIIWRAHAVARMFQRGITRQNVIDVLLVADIIETYENDQPYPSALFRGESDNKTFHVVAAYNSNSEHVYVITTYEPDRDTFTDDFRTRKS
jgi:hypothetical protein